jgi:hypothetical protein
LKRSDIPEQVILDACQAFHDGRADTPDKALADRWPAKLILARMQQLVGQGKLDYGVSLPTAWVEPVVTR